MTAATGTLLTETVNVRTGHIRARGHLTSLGADLLRGTADSLRGIGHSRVVLDLQGVLDADDAGLDILSTLRETFTEGGDQLLIRHSPERAGSPS
jgi:anti-anti-sigma regulatory factor